MINAEMIQLNEKGDDGYDYDWRRLMKMRMMMMINPKRVMKLYEWVVIIVVDDDVDGVVIDDVPDVVEVVESYVAVGDVNDDEDDDYCDD